ncbi:MAG TPA: choice-of-anchor B family protein [Acidobacteriota bacterium]
MPCRRGMSDGVYPCRNVNLQARLALNDFPGRPERAGNLWGYSDPKDGREYALVGLSNGTAVVEISEPTAPRLVGLVAALSSSFREPRVYAYINKRGQRGAVAYVATEASGSGLQVIDLSRLPDSVRLARVDRDIDTAHTLHVSNVDPATGLAVDGLAPALYAQGIRPGIGLAAFSLRRPKNPRRLGTYADNYVHDIYAHRFSGGRAGQCAADHDPCEVVFAWCGNDVRVIDFTDQRAPVLLSQFVYPGLAYAHSGWISRDQQYLFNFDEGDEFVSGQLTRILTLSIADLRALSVAAAWTGPDRSTEHNGYVVGDKLYVSHYSRGLVIFDVAQPTELREIAHFDTYPADNSTSAPGAWGVYPFLPSGTILVSDIQRGLFILREK